LVMIIRRMSTLAKSKREGRGSLVHPEVGSGGADEGEEAMERIGSKRYRGEAPATRSMDPKDTAGAPA
jgi:hypothetical protein